jgi:hypothetical protein
MRLAYRYRIGHTVSSVLAAEFSIGLSGGRIAGRWFIVRGPALLRAVSQLLWPDEDREVWFFLEKNHEKISSLPRISCSAALAENNDVRLSSRKVACSPVVPTTSTGNPGSVYTNCETA